MVEDLDSIGIRIPQVYLPRPGIDLTRWSVIACDQFTSQPEYWSHVKQMVGEAPSTLHLVFPEVYLEEPDRDERIRCIHQNMRRYLQEGLLQPYEGLIYVERTVNGKTRKGLMMCLDLEQYDFQPGSQKLIRATEETILERLPPRIKIREAGLLEVPHILVLIDDPQHTVIEPLSRLKPELQPLYDLELMLNSGHLQGYRIDRPEVEAGVVRALQGLSSSKALPQNDGPHVHSDNLLFAVGDGNHSLAAAKVIWEKMKSQADPDHPARYALVEVENVHDEGMVFESIHRVLFGVQRDLLEALRAHYPESLSYHPSSHFEAMRAEVESADKVVLRVQRIGLVTSRGCGIIEITRPVQSLPAGTLQIFLDRFVQENGAEKIDYIHGEDALLSLSSQPGNAGFFLPRMDKKDLFKSIILDGVLPRKTFSLGEAREKRFYMECRRIA